MHTDKWIESQTYQQTNQQICKKANKRYRFDTQNDDTAKMSSSNPNTLHYPLGEFQGKSPFPEFYFNFNLKVQALKLFKSFGKGNYPLGY